jgi:geranylgeranyl pyrophosphate synthase
VLAARATGANPESRALVHAGAAVELIHTASLVHDDVLDGAPVRRGAPTVLATHGEAIALAAGDLLFASSFRLLLALRGEVAEEAVLAAVERLAATSLALAEGEALQARQERDVDLSIDDYLRRCTGKTGVLFGAAMWLGATLGGQPAPVADALATFGSSVGLAFQLADDVLDCMPADAEATIGKLPGADVRDGTMTMPLLLAAARDAEVRSGLLAPPVDVQPLLERVRELGALDESRERAIAMATDAVARLGAQLAALDAHDRVHGDAMHDIAAQSVQRLS